MSAKVFPGTLADAAERGRKIAMVTAYDAPSARLADRAGVDAILVGDSAAMTVLGLESTVGVTMEEMLTLTRAVARGARRPLLVADLPFGAYQVSNRAAVTNAIRFVRDASADAVKVEGAGTTIRRAAAIVAAGVPVMGHIGLTPQTATMLGGYHPQGRTAATAARLLADARALEAAGCFALVVEAVPAEVAARITDTVRIPTIGIGSGASCDGQVLVWHDLLGLTTGHLPRFVKQYAQLADQIVAAIEAYVADVRAARFPGDAHTYRMFSGELPAFQNAVNERSDT
jgi:3-methyl-2-oxobutanoate hydroxymethyltransferase